MRVREIDRDRRERRASETGRGIHRRAIDHGDESVDERQGAQAQEAHLRRTIRMSAPSSIRSSPRIPATVIYEDELAGLGQPQASHFLVIPKIRAGLTRLSRATEDHKMLLGHLMYTASVVAKREKLAKCRSSSATAEGCQRCITHGTSWAQSYRGRRGRIARISVFSSPRLRARRRA